MDNGLPYFYDAQLKRYTSQFMRIFSGFKVKHYTSDGKEISRRVPVMYGDISRQAGHILKQNSENVVMSAPFIGCYTVNLSVDSERRQNPAHERKKTVSERQYSHSDGYTSEKGTSYTVETFMPVPYEMTMQADIWTTNRNDKDQLLEQILVLFNPSIDLQTSTNALDWTSFTTIELDNIIWSSRSVPAGLDDQMEIASLTFKLPIWINPPAKVKKQTIIHQIVANIRDLDSMEEADDYFHGTTFDNMRTLFDSGTIDAFDENEGKDDESGYPLEEQRIVITPENHRVEVKRDEIKLLGADGSEINPKTNEVYSWKDLIDQYGELVPDSSVIRLRPVNDIENWDFDFIGRLRYTEDKNILRWSVDLSTVPKTTLKAIDRIIDPQSVGPNYGLDKAKKDQRYLIVNDISETSDAWGTITAYANDIIEFDGTKWVVYFNSEDTNTVEYVTNLFSDDTLKWDGTDWSVIPDGEYEAGYWRIRL